MPTTLPPALAQPTNDAHTQTGWPALTAQSRPWTRWWWPGSAVSEKEITRHFELFQQAGIGGVEISPIYGAAGAEDKNIPYLSARWVQMLDYALREGKRLDIGVDMIVGTGWPFGGSWVIADDAAAKLLIEEFDAKDVKPIRSKEEASAQLLALTAVSSENKSIDLTNKVDATGHLDWKAPAGPWILYAAFIVGTGQQVKRASPGGEGLVLDHFSKEATQKYLEYFDEPLSHLSDKNMVRSFFNDSYEVFGANSTKNIFEEFQQRRGYDLRNYLPALAGNGDADSVRRVRSDYRETIAELVLCNFVQPWSQWTHARGALSRNQAHGSPGNLLDLYAAADIPETEAFGAEWLDYANVTPLPATPQHPFEKGFAFISKLASSAAHIANKPLCSSESFTWLGEHGHVTLEHAKAEADALFTLGVNHIFFHGTPFSPADAQWPGWMFYASTHFAPTNSFWRDLPALNNYIARCQVFLQNGKPDNEVLIYLPIYDLYSSENGSRDWLQFMTVHNADQWLTNMPGFSGAINLLWDRGYGFDCVSDDLLKTTVQFQNNKLQSEGAFYRTLLVPDCEYIPLPTLERFMELAREGATILIAGELPQDVPGLGDLENSRAKLQIINSAFKGRREISPGVQSVAVGKGQFLFSQNIEYLLRAAAINRETLVDEGIKYIRRGDGEGEYIYFLSNLSQNKQDKWFPLAVPAKDAVLYDAASGHYGSATLRQHNGRCEIYLQMEPNQSLLLRIFSENINAPQWNYYVPAGTVQEIKGKWSVEFIEGGPALPRKKQITQLSSWTDWPEEREALRAFSGTARYTIYFEKPPNIGDAWQLDLGEVNYSARVRLNGENLETLIAAPFLVTIPHQKLQENNRLEIEVSNMMANRMADLDRRKMPWRNFFFVNIDYKPFDASNWEPLPSGLIGPVRLLALRSLDPAAGETP